MYALPRTNYLRRSLLVNNQQANQPSLAIQSKRIKQQLRALGVSGAVLLTQESRYLPHIIHPDETIWGVVYGKTKDGFAMLLATNRRVIYLDKKPLFVNQDEVTYDVVSGVNRSHVGLGTTLILHTRIKDYVVQTLNDKCARGFVNAIEQLKVESKEQEEEWS